jgi:hypothetical protein
VFHTHSGLSAGAASSQLLAQLLAGTLFETQSEQPVPARLQCILPIFHASLYPHAHLVFVSSQHCAAVCECCVTALLTPWSQQLTEVSDLHV